jgi:glycerate kinase
VIQASDGGDGLLDALATHITRWTSHDVFDPLLRTVRVRVGWIGTEAIIESCLAIGLSLLTAEERDPRRTSTLGLGQLMAAAADAGAERVFVGLGGSASMDGGVGMARAWGFEALGEDGNELTAGGGDLRHLVRMAPGQPPSAEVVGLCDVATPLLGPRGARVFARQKGASPDGEEELHQGLERLVDVLGAGAAAALPGAGAAGGLGFGLQWFAGARLLPGAAWVLDRLGFDDTMRGAAAVLVGEGAFDRTSLEGKLNGVVLARAEAAGATRILVAPRAEHVPVGTVVETGGGTWDLAELEARAHRAVGQALGLLGT